VPITDPALTASLARVRTGPIRSPVRSSNTRRPSTDFPGPWPVADSQTQTSRHQASTSSGIINVTHDAISVTAAASSQPTSRTITGAASISVANARRDAGAGSVASSRTERCGVGEPQLGQRESVAASRAPQFGQYLSTVVLIVIPGYFRLRSEASDSFARSRRQPEWPLRIELSCCSISAQ
jgi:hypothetical protein